MILFKNAIYLAWADTRAKYRKSTLGPLWMTLGNVIGILGLSLVWANLLKEDLKTFVPSLTIGMIVWQLISCTIGEGATTFFRQAGVMRNVYVPAWFFVIRSLSRQIISLFHNIILIIGVIWYFKIHLSPTSLLALIGIFLVVLNLCWMNYLLGMLGARFRDVEFLVNGFLPILFFISPVIFRPDRLPVSLNVIWLNPLSYFIEVVRAPFLGHCPTINTYIIMIGLLMGGFVLTYLADRLFGRRLAFWV